MRPRVRFTTVAAGALVLLALVPAAEAQPFGIEVVDAQTKRGVPLVELKTTGGIRYVTDSAGRVTFHEPGLMNRQVYFHISSHGYTYPKDGFGYRGKALRTKPGGRARIVLRRVNVAERLYRITGQGIYRDTLLLGLPAPIAAPALNGRVVGQDSCQAVMYQGRVFWIMYRLDLADPRLKLP